MTSKEGFSVVAPMKVMWPASTCGRKASCWALLKRWTSSTNTMVRYPERALYSAAAMTSLISLMPARTALKETNSACVRRAMRRASVVLPQPGGPQKSIEPMLSLSICRRRGLPGPRSFSWPINSSSVRGRMRSASGWLAAGTSASPAVAGSLENRLIGPLSLNRLTGKRKCGDAWEKQLSMVSFKWLVKTRKAKTRSPTSACGRVAATYGKRKDARLRSGPLQGLGVELAGGFVEDDRGGSGGVEGLNATGHGNADAGVGAALGFSGKAGAFVADEERDGLTPVDLPGGQQRLATLFG